MSLQCFNHIRRAGANRQVAGIKEIVRFDKIEPARQMGYIIFLKHILDN
jgi:hypothetical protein